MIPSHLIYTKQASRKRLSHREALTTGTRRTPSASPTGTRHSPIASPTGTRRSPSASPTGTRRSPSLSHRDSALTKRLSHRDSALTNRLSHRDSAHQCLSHRDSASPIASPTGTRHSPNSSNLRHTSPRGTIYVPRSRPREQKQSLRAVSLYRGVHRGGKCRSPRPSDPDSVFGKSP
ncbi:hypothetical protein Adt_16805 [Abeliophyllum distichum]|uniref:Uncharacterized protein n=1 Tax=Abeliophyllum distichum TaxID=126358 RepID=A0ABD1TF80_9LAMI